MSKRIDLITKPKISVPLPKNFSETVDFNTPGFDPIKQNSIESGYFVFTLMPSLRCKLNCPHCYLSLEQRRNSPIMSVEDLTIAAQKVADYYDARPKIEKKMIVFYWYGGEPTDMGFEYMIEAFQALECIFPAEKGYYTKHDILTSLVKIDSQWFDVFRTWGQGHFQTSFDGIMRGKEYVRLWEQRVNEAVDSGLDVSTISVVNNELIKDSPEEILDYLCSLNIKEASFLPFMLNEQNQAKHYNRFAPNMEEYSKFMIRLMKYWYQLVDEGKSPPEIGQSQYIISRQSMPPSANIAGQTLFLLPEGDFVLPDYKDGFLEFMQPFGNIFDQTFEEVTRSPERRAYLRRQYTRNYNPECLSCVSMHNCIMEFWKENRSGDECFGAKKFVNWLVKEEREQNVISKWTNIMS
ncbi:radical SAM protein [Vibrio splendidus]